MNLVPHPSLDQISHWESKKKDGVAFFSVAGPSTSTSPVTCGTVVLFDKGRRADRQIDAGIVSNDYASLLCIAEIMQFAWIEGINRLEIYSDSSVLSRFSNGKIADGGKHIQRLRQTVHSFTGRFQSVEINRCSRLENVDARELARQELAWNTANWRISARHSRVNQPADGVSREEAICLLRRAASDVKYFQELAQAGYSCSQASRNSVAASACIVNLREIKLISQSEIDLYLS